MSRPEFILEADEIVDAAVEIFRRDGLDAVSMRNVSQHLGVSPVPLYSRVGNRAALVEAVADRLLADLAPTAADDEPWDAYALRWATELRLRLRSARDSRLIARHDRAAYVEASRPLVAVMRRDGIAADDAVRACRLLMWATVGFGAIESGVSAPPRRRTTRLGADPGGVDPADLDALFTDHLRYLLDGLRSDLFCAGSSLAADCHSPSADDGLPSSTARRKSTR